MSKVFFILGMAVGFESYIAFTTDNFILAIPNAVLALASLAVLFYVYGLDFKAIFKLFRGTKR